MAQKHEPEHDVHHDEDAHRFYVEVDDQTAYLDYSQKDRSTLDFQSTFTPPDLRGQGLASEITQRALDWARHHEMQVIPSCPFVRDFIDENPEYEAIATRPE